MITAAKIYLIIGELCSFLSLCHPKAGRIASQYSPYVNIKSAIAYVFIWPHIVLLALRTLRGMR